MIRLLWIRDEFEWSLGRMPTKEELMKNEEVISEYNKFKKLNKMKVDLDTFVSYLDYTEPVQSLQEPVPNTEELILEDIIPDPRSEEANDLTDIRDLLQRLLSVLDQEELAIHNLMAEDYQRKEICEKLNMEPSRFDYLKKRSRKKINKLIDSDKDVQEVLFDLTMVSEKSNVYTEESKKEG